MKKTIAVLTLVAVTAGGVQTVSAGDREWATAGKILTGLVAAQVISRAIEPAPVVYQARYYPAPPVYTQAPVYVTPPQPVYYAPPQPVYAPAPVVVYAQPPVCMAPPVYYPAPQYYAPAPVVSFNFGFGHHHGHHYRGW